jgi:PAS domain S-box-containing protein
MNKDEISETTGQNNLLNNIQNYLIAIAEGNLDTSLEIPDGPESTLAAIHLGINMLVEELKSTSISRSYLNSVYNGINDMLIVLDAKGKIMTINNVVNEVILFSNEELIGENVVSFIHADSKKLFLEGLNALKTKSKVAEVRLNFVTKSKNVIPFSCSFSILFNDNNNPNSILLVAKDITALINSIEQLKNKNEELNLFVYKASHDLKSPISSMMGIMSIINNTKDENEIKTCLKMLDDCIQLSNNVINDLLILGRITYGKLHFENIDINQVIDNILNVLVKFIGFNEIKIDIDIDESIQAFYTEKGLFQSIMLNLMENAIKYRQHGAKNSYLKIQIAPYDKGILIEVEDNGVGIKETHHPNIMKMFYRATQNSHGSGLGLYIVKMSFFKLNGSITFDSTYLKGTIFKIYLPSQTA